MGTLPSKVYKTNQVGCCVLKVYACPQAGMRLLAFAPVLVW